MNIHQPFEQSKFYNDMRMGQFNFNAFVNPNDPSKLYTQQPQQQWSFICIVNFDTISKDIEIITIYWMVSKENIAKFALPQTKQIKLFN